MCESTVLDQHWLDEITAFLERLAQQIHQNVQRSEPKYTKMFADLLDAPFIVESHAFSSGISYTEQMDVYDFSKDKPSFIDDFDEEFSDACYSSLIGDKATSRPPCQITTSCVNFFRKSKASGLSHFN